MAFKIKNHDALTIEQKLEAAQIFTDLANDLEGELAEGTKPKLNSKGEVTGGAALSPLDVQRKRRDMLDYKLEAIALRGSAQENDLSALRKRLASMTRRCLQLEQLCRMHGLKMPGYEMEALEEVAPTSEKVEEVAAPAVDVAPVDVGAAPTSPTSEKVAKPSKSDVKARGKVAAKTEARTRGKAAVVAPKADVYEPRNKMA